MAIMKNSADLIVQYFDYLTNEYEFQIVKKEFFPQDTGNAIVNYKSSKYEIKIVAEMGTVSINLVDQLDINKQWFDFSSIIKYYAPQIEGLDDFAVKPADSTWDDVIESQLIRLSCIMRQYCEPLLKGNNWAKDEIKKIAKERKFKW